jgi:hypothetical protein
MQSHSENNSAAQGKYMEPETLLEQGRRLHSAAIFAVCAGIFKQLPRLSLFQKPGFPAAGKDLRTVGSD